MFFEREAKFAVKLGVLENRAKDMLDNIENASYTNRDTMKLIDDLDNSYVELGQQQLTIMLPTILYRSLTFIIIPLNTFCRRCLLKRQRASNST